MVAVIAGASYGAWHCFPRDLFSMPLHAASMDVTKLYAPHKALYDFRMISADSSAGISGIKGQMFYTQDDACDAWTSEHRFRTVYQYPEKRPVLNVNTYTAWEAKDASLFHFRSERSEGGQLSEEISGTLTRSADGTAKAVYTKPENKSFDLAKGYRLPNAQTNEILQHAMQGKNFYTVTMFDGTDAEGPVQTNTFIGKKATAQELAEIAAKTKNIDAKLLTAEAWHVHMAVFPLADKEAMLPTYEMDMILHANGVVSHVVIDYKSFKVEQSLTALETLPLKKCS